MNEAESQKAKARGKGTAVNVVKCEVRGKQVLQTRDKNGHILNCFWGLTPKQEQAIVNSIIKREQKKSKLTKPKTKYDPQELFERLAEAHRKLADSLGKESEPAKRRYHEELAETFAFLANNNDGEDQELSRLTRIPPMFKGALIMTMPDEFKRISRRIDSIEKNRKPREY